MRTTREKIVIACAVLALLYGLFEFVVRRPPTASPRPARPAAARGDTSEDILTWIAENQLKFAQATVTPFQARMVQQAAHDWSEDMFLHGRLPEELRAEAEARRAQVHLSQTARQQAEEQRRRELAAIRAMFVYSGYVFTGADPHAVVNGVAYRQGETLVGEAYRLKSVTPESVTIESVAGDVEFTVPLDE